MKAIYISSTLDGFGVTPYESTSLRIYNAQLSLIDDLSIVSLRSNLSPSELSKFDYVVLEYRVHFFDQTECVRECGVPYFLVSTEGRNLVHTEGEQGFDFVAGAEGVWPMSDKIIDIVRAEKIMRVDMPYMTKFLNDPTVPSSDQFLGVVEIGMWCGWEGVIESCKIVDECGYTPLVRGNGSGVENSQEGFGRSRYS